MVIHTKEKTKIHVKFAPEAKIKGRNVLVVDKSPRIAGPVKELKADKADKRLSVLKIKSGRKDHKESGKEPDKNTLSAKGNPSAKKEAGRPTQKEKGVYAQFKKSKQDREKVIGKKNSTAKVVASAGAMTALDQMEGGNEVYDAVP